MAGTTTGPATACWTSLGCLVHLTVTEPGAVRVELVFERVTTAPPAGATFDSVTVQVVKAFWPMLAGLQPSDDTPREPRRLTLVVTAVSLRLAVIVAA